LAAIVLPVTAIVTTEIVPLMMAIVRNPRSAGATFLPPDR